MNNKKKGFTLIETIVGLALLIVIVVFIFPSIITLASNADKLKENTRIIYALEEAIEREKSTLNSETTYVIRNENINGFDIEISVSKYENNSNIAKIRAKTGSYELCVLERR